MIEAQNRPGRQDIAALTATTLAGFLLRLSLIPTRQIIENDGPYYAALAAQILRSEILGALNDYWSQLYPVLIALVGLFTGEVELAARLTSAICGAALVPAVWWLTYEIGDRTAAYIAAIVIAVQPWLLVFSTLALTEITFTLFIVIGLALIVRAARLGDARRFAMAGVVTALAILTRPEGLLLVPFLLLAGARSFSRARRWEAARQLAAGLGALVIVMTPQTIGTYQIYGHVNWLWKSNVAASVADQFNDPGQLERTIYTFREDSWDLPARATDSAPSVWERAAASMRRIGQNAGLVRDGAMLKVWLPVAWKDADPTASTKLLIAALALLGILGATRPSALVVVLFGFAYAGALFSTLVHARLLVPLVPIALIPIALGASMVLQGLFDRWPRLRIPSILLAASAVVFIAQLNYQWASSPRNPFGPDPVAQKQAGEWLRVHASQSTRMVSHNPQAPYYFYEGWPFEQAGPIPWAAPEDVLKFAQGQRAEYIVIEEWVIRAGGYPIAAWLDAPEDANGVVLAESFGKPPYRVFIFRVDPGAPAADD